MPERAGQTPEQKKQPYYLAAQYEEEQPAGTAYFTIQALIEKSELSTYRFMTPRDEQWYVLVIGDQPSAEVRQKIEAALRSGTLVTLPPDVLSDFMQRRKEQIKKAPWVEGHYRPIPKKGGRGGNHGKRH